MNKGGNDKPYDKKDERSILEYAGKLMGHTFLEMGVWDPEAEQEHKNKGDFGQVLEREYFLIPNNNSPEPDFKDARIELKTTPMKRLSDKKLVPKERLVLSIIDYMEINDLKFEGSFEKKNGKLLIVFYEWSKDKKFYDYRVVKVVFWEFPPEDLRIIREDWNIIAGMVKDGKADQLSERLTRYLAACRKGVGHDGDQREQPFSDVPAKQRALSFKPSYVGKMFRDSKIERHKGLFVNDARTSSEYQSIFEVTGWDNSETFEEYVQSYFKKFIGKKCRDIEDYLGIEHQASKSKRAILVRRMMGIKTSRIKEFEDAGICAKTIFLKDNNMSQESMSFPYFKYNDVAEQTWETSDFSRSLDKRFFFAVFQRKKGDDDDTFIGTFFWSMPYGDLMEAKDVWNRTAERIRTGEMHRLPKETESLIAHVRDHARNNKDRITAPDGNEYVKKCFWLNRGYISKIVKESGILDKDKDVQRKLDEIRGGPGRI